MYDDGAAVNAISVTGGFPGAYRFRDWEKKAIPGFHALYPMEIHRRVANMILVADEIAVSAASMWRVLRHANRLQRFSIEPSQKGAMFERPLQPLEHSQAGIDHINIQGTFNYLGAVLECTSR